MKYEHIPLEQMLDDLRVTKQELAQYCAENEVLSKDYQRNRVSIYMNEGRIGKRRDFIAQLEIIIKETYGEEALNEE